MPDFDLRKSMENGMDFKKILAELLFVAISLFIALSWNNYIAEVVAQYFPKGQNLGEKFGINIALTFILSYGCYSIMHLLKKKEVKV